MCVEREKKEDANRKVPGAANQFVPARFLFPFPPDRLRAFSCRPRAPEPYYSDVDVTAVQGV